MARQCGRGHDGAMAEAGAVAWRREADVVAWRCEIDTGVDTGEAATAQARREHG